MKKSTSLKKGTREQVSNTTKKGLTKIQNDLYDVDSLNVFKQKKIENIDNKFMLLKSELNSLFLNPSKNANEKVTKNVANCDQKSDCLKYKKHQECNTSFSDPKSTEFSEWLSDTIEKLNCKFPTTKTSEELDHDKLPSSTTEPHIKSKYNMTLLPNHKVECLLYKSFQLKNLGIYSLSSSDDSEAEERSSKIKNQKKRKCKRPNTRSSKTFSSAFPRRNFKRKRASLDSDIEIINVETNLKNDECNRIQHVDLVAESLDWSEPFYTKSPSDCSDLEIIEDIESDALKMEKKNDHVEVHEKDKDFSSNAQEQNTNKTFMNPDTKRTWECPICFEPSQGQSIVTTLCGHIFCKACLEEHKSAQGKFCPTCRLDLSDKPTITLFNL